MTRQEMAAYLFSTLLIGAGCVALLVSLGVASDTKYKSTTVEKHQVALPGLPVTGPEDQTRYRVLSERPIFIATRRAVPVQVPVEKVEPVVQAMPLSIILLGILGSGKEKIVLVKRTNSIESTSLRQGQEVDGWAVEEIKNDAAVFRNGDSHQTLYLPDNRKAEP